MRFLRHARMLALVLLLVMTAIGMHAFVSNDPSETAEHWLGHLGVLPIVAIASILDVSFECIAWMWVYARFGIRSHDRAGVCCFLAGRAGFLLPAQLGRIISPDAMARLGRAPLSRCLTAEAGAFMLNATSAAALLCALLASMFVGSLVVAPIVAVVVVGCALLIGSRLVQLFDDSKLAVPPGFLLSRSAFAIVFIQMMGWTVHGVGLWVLIRGLGPVVTLPDTVLHAAASAVLGVGSGLPGGVGATEGLLGVSLSLMQVPGEHLAVAIGAFRLLTFWAWLPVGWLALGLTTRFVRGQSATQRGEDSDEREPEIVVNVESSASRVGESGLSKG